MIAQPGVGLVHVCGRQFRDSQGFFQIQRLIGLTFLDPSWSTERTLAAESALGIPRSVYFYVGHVSPWFGNVVFVFSSVICRTREFGVSPFDSGGLAHGHFPADEPGGIGEYFGRHLYSPSRPWRADFSSFIGRQFSGLVARYVLGQRPENPDRSPRLEASDRRAWTWEVRIAEAVPVSDSILMRLSADVLAALRVALIKSADARWLALLREATMWWQDRSEDVPLHAAVETEIARWMVA